MLPSGDVTSTAAASTGIAAIAAAKNLFLIDIVLFYSVKCVELASSTP